MLICFRSLWRPDIDDPHEDFVERIVSYAPGPGERVVTRSNIVCERWRSYVSRRQLILVALYQS